ncbi:MAG: hypothetical protein IJV64_02970 [Oscillospiraceae bacterium]|nr:hypothetical protein [Oscillospiraceae bacterium]
MRTDLPETCLSTMPGTGELIVLKRGEKGYYRSEWETGDAERNKQIADDHNRARGLSPAQVEAMRVGSMFGFTVPGADPQRYLDAATEENTYPVDGIIKDPVMTLYHPIKCDMHEYKIVGQYALYLELAALPETMMGEKSDFIMLAEMVGGVPLIPIHAKMEPNDTHAMTLADGGFSHGKEVNQGYQIIAKVRVGEKEFVLAESPTAPSRFATWARTPANDGDGPPNYYWGHYSDDRVKAVQDFCDRAKEQYEFVKQLHRPAPQRENNMER